MKILNLYCGIGGNRKLWGNKHNITAVENNFKIANIYKNFFPKDTVIIDDAHKFLLNHFKEYDFIWSSPPCPSHSRMRYNHKNKIYPDLNLYQEILLLKYHFKGKWLIENVIPYYDPLIKQNFILSRHSFWCNFDIIKKDFDVLHVGRKLKEREFLEKRFKFNLSKYNGVDKRLLLRNCVNPDLGKHIFNCAF